MLVAELFELYRRDRLLGSPANTVRAYRSAIRSLERHKHGGRMPATDTLHLAELTGDFLAGAMAGLIAAGRSPATANRLLRHVRPLLSYAERSGHLVEPVHVRPLREPRRIVRTTEPAEMQQLLRFVCTLPAGVPNYPATIGHWPAATWWYAVLLTSYWTGLRCGALLTARSENLDLARGELLIEAADQKQRADQLFELPPDLQAALAELTEPADRVHLFAWPWDRRRDGSYSGRWETARRHLRRILTGAGLPAGRKHLWHNQRRHTATQATIRGGIDAARRLLGHSAEHVTRRYIDAGQAPDRIRPADVLPPPGIEPPPRFRVVG